LLLCSSLREGEGKGGNIGKTDEKLISDLISIHNAENWLGMDGEDRDIYV